MDNDLTRTIFGDQLGIRYTLAESMNILHHHGLINIGELAEKAISKKSNVPQARTNQEGFDLINGIEIKHGQTHMHSSGKKMIAWLSKKNKTGRMLAVITESVTGQQYYFDIPYDVYSTVEGNAFAITFELDGTPIKRSTSRYHPYMPNWWDYEIESFNTLCSIAENHNSVL